MRRQFFAECVMLFVAGCFGGLGRLKAHVVPTEVLKAAAGLGAKALGPHGRSGSTLAGQQSGREGGERLGFTVHGGTRPLLADHPAAEAADGTWAGSADTGRSIRRREDCAAEILFETVGDVIP